VGRLCSTFWLNLSKNLFLGSYTLVDGVKFGVEDGTSGPLLYAKFHPRRCTVSPLRGEKPQNRPLSKLNTGGLLPVKKRLKVCTMICLLFASNDVIPVPGNTTTQRIECRMLTTDRATTRGHNDKRRNRFLQHKRVK